MTLEKKAAWMLAFIQVVKNSTQDTWSELPERAKALLEGIADETAP